MRILFSSNKNPGFITITEYIEKALKKICETTFFENRAFIIPGRIRKAVRFLDRADLKRINGNLVSAVKRYKPDIFLEVGGHRIFADTVVEIKKQGIKTALWTVDPPRDFEPIIKVAPYYDFVFNGGSEAGNLLRPYNIKNIHFLPFACDPDFHKPVDVSTKEKEYYGNDIVFVGSFYENRMRILGQVSDFDIGIWGPGWEKIPRTALIKKCIRHTGGVEPEEWKKIYSSCKIAIAIHYQDGRIPCYQASPRVYEALACGCFLLSDNQKDVGMLFNKGEHLDIFRDGRELRAKIDYYLKHPEMRKGIAHRGYREVIERHSYNHRINEMLNIIRKDL
ncbi:MAG: glycosyltransferase [Candidatus Omnitrophica bacterium]|nr:glycosyltransferase [Candidatus Omnitrophota bacterium]